MREQESIAISLECYAGLYCHKAGGSRHAGYAEALTPKGLITLCFDENIITRRKTDAKKLTGD